MHNHLLLGLPSVMLGNLPLDLSSLNLKHFTTVTFSAVCNYTRILSDYNSRTDKSVFVSIFCHNCRHTSLSKLTVSS